MIGDVIQNQLEDRVPEGGCEAVAAPLSHQIADRLSYDAIAYAERPSHLHHSDQATLACIRGRSSGALSRPAHFAAIYHQPYCVNIHLPSQFIQHLVWHIVQRDRVLKALTEGCQPNAGIDLIDKRFGGPFDHSRPFLSAINRETEL